MATLVTSAFPDAIKVQYEKRLLTRALPRMVHSNWTMKATLSKTGSYELRKYDGLSAVTTPLNAEGTTPAEQPAPAMSKITLTPLFYGSWIGFTDILDLEQFDPIISNMSGILGEQAGQSVDMLFRAALIADATVDYAGGASAIGSLAYPDNEVSYMDLLIQWAAIESENALPPDGGYFPVIVHPHTYTSLMLDPIFVNMFNQESPSSAMRTGYVGTLLSMKFFVTSNAYEQADVGSGSTTDVYSALILGKESHGSVSFAGWMPGSIDSGGDDPTINNTGKSIAPLSIIAKPIGSAGSDDPLNQRGSLAWKMSFAVDVLNASWIRNLKHTTVFSND